MCKLSGVGMASASQLTPAKAEPARDVTSKDWQVNPLPARVKPANLLPTAPSAVRTKSLTRCSRATPGQRP